MCGVLVFVYLEEEDGVARSNDQGLVVDEVHRAEICGCETLLLALVGLLSLGSEAMALPVEGMAVFRLGTVERLNREVELRAVLHLRDSNITQLFLKFPRVSKMILFFLNAMVYRDINVVIFDEGASYEWLVESFDWDRAGVQSEVVLVRDLQGVQVLALVVQKVYHEEAKILIGDGEIVTFCILFNKVG